MEIFGFFIDDFYARSLIQFIITFFIGAILLHLATGILGIKNRRFGTAFGTVLVGSVFSFSLMCIFGHSMIGVRFAKEGEGRCHAEEHAQRFRAGSDGARRGSGGL